MKQGGVGGANTKTGLHFEQKVNLQSRFESLPGYSVRELDGAGSLLCYGDDRVGRVFEKGEFYKFLSESKVDWRIILSKQLIPDNALLVEKTQTLFIVEVKFQQVAGSVDEKPQTCDFKRKQYVKLTHSLHLKKVEYVYVMNDFFKKPKYKDMLDYIRSVGCHYFFHVIPLCWLGLPAARSER